jgi:hypothetical protein
MLMALYLMVESDRRNREQMVVTPNSTGICVDYQMSVSVGQLV